MDFLTRIAPPDIAIMTAIKPVHLNSDQFSSTNAVFDEKKKIILNMKKGGEAFITLDDKYIPKISSLDMKMITYSQKEKAGVYATDIEQTEEGLKFVVHWAEKPFRAFVPLFGEYHLSYVLPAIIAGLTTKVPVNKIQEALKGFTLPPGRLSLIEGIKDTLILDSSYNASPEAVKESLKVLDFFGKKREARRVFVFGNMNELGDYSKQLHQEVGEQIPGTVDLLITVGGDVHYGSEMAQKNGFPGHNIHNFDNVNEAVKFYKNEIKNGDIILAKGSQNKVRLEIFVKAFMLRPEEAKDTLVRQSKNWENIAP